MTYTRNSPLLIMHNFIFYSHNQIMIITNDQQGVLKNQKYFLSPADFTPSAFMYEESKKPIAIL